MYSAEDLRSVLLCRVVESDYLSGDQRTAVINRLNKYFQEEKPQSDATIAESRRKTFDIELMLAVASPIIALTGTLFVAFSFLDRETIK
jgi:hypothetical protein